MRYKPRKFNVEPIQINQTKIFFTPFGPATSRPGDWAFPVQDDAHNYAMLFEADVFNSLFEPLTEEENAQVEADLKKQKEEEEKEIEEQQEVLDQKEPPVPDINE